jgi:16S rRNA (cytosine1402-N4)-methyltransferase
MMSGRGSEQLAVAGGPVRHVPVLGPHVLASLGVRQGGIYVDGTFGAGGHSRAILATAETKVIGIDRDRNAIANGVDLVEAFAGRLVLVEENFSVLDQVAQSFGYQEVDGVVLDLGVSSMQLDEPGRGFSFRLNGPLDMRMGATGPRAADVVACASERDLADIITTLGEERQARKIAQAIVTARRATPIRTTRALAEIVSRVVGPGRGDIHPATRTFQALRIFVNDELRAIAAALAAAERVLAPGARLAVISFHSLEDRIVKNFLAVRSSERRGSRHAPEVVAPPPSFRLLARRPIVPDAAEIAANPRARSAKLRVAERTQTPPISKTLNNIVPRLPPLVDVVKGA